jgi:hypothetical protein
MGAAFKPFERHLHDDSAARATEILGAELFERERARGSTLSLEGAIGEAREIVDAGESPPR